jgi:1-acyl-sn-glycerol-3-phosphate acyltransferase
MEKFILLDKFHLRMADDISQDRIDIDAILEAKAPKLKKKLPGFVIRYLKKIAHQDDLNLFFRKYGHLQGPDFAAAILEDFKISIKIEGEENLPENGRVIFASNHPLGGADGVAILLFLSNHYENVKAPVNDLLMHVENLSDFFIPINKMGGQAKDSTTLINKTYESDASILFFPSGMVSRKQKGGIKDLIWKKTFITKAIQYKRDIVPLQFVGLNSSFFYNLGYIRTKMGIKANIEMLYLVDELYKQRNKTFTIKIGKPIPWKTFDSSKSSLQWANWVKDIVYDL